MNAAEAEGGGLDLPGGDSSSPPLDSWGRALFCDICGDRLPKHPGAGHPRLRCSDECARIANVRRKAQARADAARERRPKCSECGTDHGVPPLGGCSLWNARIDPGLGPLFEEVASDGR